MSHDRRQAPLFSRGEMLEFRLLCESSLPDECDVFRYKRTTASGGRVIETWEAEGTVPCRLAQGMMAMQPVATTGQPEALNRWVVVIPIDTEVEEGWRLVVHGHGLDGAAWTRTLVAVQALGPKTYEVLRKVVASEVGVGGR